MKPSLHRNHRLLAVGLLSAVVVAGAFVVFRSVQKRHPPATQSADSSRTASGQSSNVPLPPIDAGPFSNASHSVPFVGSQVCASCHESEYASYLKTAHSRALAKVDPSAEPPDGEFIQQATGRTYSVYRKEGEMRHREAIGVDDERLVFHDMPMKYVIGSGHYSRSYMAESDGFLLESPITWFASTKRWDMSPGYERAGHAGFRRVTDFGCVVCHAGRVEPVQHNRFRVKIHEQSISCENCHGPGGQHVDYWKQPNAASDSPDMTIVNFGQLTRQQSEMICSQCHLRGAATVTVKDRSISDYLPGMRLTDFRVDYRLKEPGKAMKVTGHVEQMRLSACYQNSPQMSCTSCHDPHAPPTAGNRIDYFRNQCLNCHADQGCALPETDRSEKDNNCIACHMPSSPTDIDHFAFTHHRVGIHDETPPAPADEPIGELVPITKIDHLPLQEQQRTLGLAYLEFAEKQPDDAAFDAYRSRSFQVLTELRRGGLQDVDLEEALARMHWETGRLPDAIQLAENAMAMTPDRIAERTNSLFVLAESHLRMGAIGKAVPHLEKLVRLRRVSEDWNLLAICRVQLGKPADAIAALEQSVEIDPYRIDTVQMLAELTQQHGTADDHQRWQKRLELLRQAAESPP